MTAEELTISRLRMAALSDEDDNEGAEPLILEEGEELETDDFGEFVDDDEEEEGGKEEAAPEKEEDGKMSLEELREKELGE